MNRLVPVLATLPLLLASACGHTMRYYLDKGNTQVAQGNYQAAEVNFRKVIQMDPNNGEGYFQLSSVLLRLRKTQEGYTALSRAAELLPNRDDVIIRLADLTLQSYLGDNRRPRALYEKIAALSDQLLARNAESYDGLRLKGHLAAADRKYSEAEEFYGHANRLKPMQSQVVMAWAEVLFQDKQPERAEALAFQLIAKEKSYGPVYDLLYSYYAREKKPAEAERILQSRVTNNPADAEGVLHLAAYYSAVSREADLQVTLHRILDNPNVFPRAHLQAGDFYARFRRWDDAFSQYQAGAKGDAKEKIAYQKKMVDMLLAEGKGSQADGLVDEILKEQPGDEAAQDVKASFLLASRKPENIAKAVVMFQALLEKKPDDAARHFNLGRALAAKGDTDGARMQFQEAVQRRRDYLPPRMALIEMSQARGDHKTTLQYADQILSLYPGLARVRLMRAVALMNTSREFDARKELTGLERAAPQDGEVQLQIAILDLRERKLKDAETLFRRLAPEDGGDGRAVSGLAAALIAENQNGQALEMLRERLKKSPNSIALKSVLARTAAGTGQYDIAIEQYRQMLADAPNSEQTAIALGTAYRMKGDFQNAISFFEKARALAPNDPEPMVRLAGAEAFFGRRPEALDNYRRALKLRPDDPSSLNNSAYLIAETAGNLDEALTLAKKAVQEDSTQPNYLDTLGWVYLKKHLDDSAAQVFRGLTEKYPDNAVFHYHFGMALLAKGDKNGAGAEFRAALSKRPTEEVKGYIVSAMARIG